MSAAHDSATAASQATREPLGPFPGLRPFLEHEELLIYGREAQVDGLVHCLAQSCFVAVLGGSGSGKSSLVRAGVVPHLRQYGIPEVGDLWLPVVFTPGTNAANPAPAELAASMSASTRASSGSSMGTRRTALTRLVWRLEKDWLRGPPDPQRREDMAQILRRPGGFGRLVDAYSSDLALPVGVETSQARILLVIDQFEELFDRSNLDDPDARLLIERVIDHFHTAARLDNVSRQRCFVVLTMRSEHLNDCAAYPGLADAINRSSYLVSRLEEADLREAIVRPVERFLRLRQRQQRRQKQAGGPALPEAIDIDATVVDRLVADTERLAHNPDHLPLLQHALARTWAAALYREQQPTGGLPQRITRSDLIVAVRGPMSAEEGPQPDLADDENTLMLSLQHCAEAMYLRCFATQERQDAFTALLERLAYKDPRTGTYNQQRVNVTPDNRAQLEALVFPDFADEGGYLYWDDDNPEQITLKVQHEAFIRGWSRLRHLADLGATRFQRWMQMLDAARQWQAGHRQAQDLLTERALTRLEDDGIPTAWADPRQRAQWLGLLGHLDQLSDPAELTQCCDQFLSASKTAIDAEKKARAEAEASRRLAQRTRHRRRRLAFVAIFVLIMPALWICWAVLVKAPQSDRSAKYFEAVETIGPPARPGAFAPVDAHRPKLEQLLKAEPLLLAARTGEGIFCGGCPELPVLNWFADATISRAMRRADTLLSERMRPVLSGGVWSVPVTSAPLPVQAGGRCDGREGLLVEAESPSAAANAPRRGLFLTSALGAAEHNEASHYLYVAQRDAQGRCQLGINLTTLPAHLEPRLLASRSLSHLLVTTREEAAPDAPPGGGGTITGVHSIAWRLTSGGTEWTADPPERTALIEWKADEAVALPHDPLALTPTWETSAGTVLQVGTQRWRLIGSEARVLSRYTAASPPPSQPLLAAAPDSLCGRAAARWTIQPGTAAPRAYEEEGGRCLLQIVAELPDGQKGHGFRWVSDQSADPNTPQTVLDSFSFGALPDNPRLRWHAGQGTYQGWLLAELDGVWWGQPRTAKALVRLGREVLNPSALGSPLPWLTPPRRTTPPAESGRPSPQRAPR